MLYLSAIYDSLFEGRICMQKVLSAANQLPQYDTYKLFLKEHDQNYIKNLSAAKAASKDLLNSLLQIQVQRRLMFIIHIHITMFNFDLSSNLVVVGSQKPAAAGSSHRMPGMCR